MEDSILKSSPSKDMAKQNLSNQIKLTMETIILTAVNVIAELKSPSKHPIE